MIMRKIINYINFTDLHFTDINCEASSLLQWRKKAVYLHDYLLVPDPNWFYIIIVE